MTPYPVTGRRFYFGSFASAGMNSLNHYAYGAVFGWMFTNIVGINPDESAPGYARVIYAPVPDKRIARVKGSIDTAHGTVSAEYELKEGVAFHRHYTRRGSGSRGENIR